MAILGDLFNMESRLRDYNPELVLAYVGYGQWTVLHQGRQGRPYAVLTIGKGTGNRWPKDDPKAPEVDRPDMRLLYLIRDADLAARGGEMGMLRDLELQGWIHRHARQQNFDNYVADVARDYHPFHVRDVDGAPDHRITFPKGERTA